MEFERRKHSLNSRSMLGYLQDSHKYDQFLYAASPDLTINHKKLKNQSPLRKFQINAHNILMHNKKHKSSDVSPCRSIKRHSLTTDQNQNCIDQYINSVISELELDKFQLSSRDTNRHKNAFDKYLGPDGEKEEEILRKALKTYDYLE